jgi:hypothetical protein
MKRIALATITNMIPVIFLPEGEKPGPFSSKVLYNEEI